MSTRATYRFSPPSGSDMAAYRKPVTLYVHYDGYPEGAACYFYAMLIHTNQRGYGPEQFLRANADAELTTGHDAHGDTDYRYDLEGCGPGATIRAHRRYRTHGEAADRWELVFVGTLSEFLDKQAATKIGREYMPEYSRFRLLKVRDYDTPRWFNRETARTRIDGERYSILSHLRVWDANGACLRNSANWIGQAAELRALVTEFPELNTAEIAGLLVPHADEQVA